MKRGVMAAIGLFSMLLLSQAVPVQAAEKPKVFLDVQDYAKNERTLKVSCMLENGDGVTNGKLRIYYEADKVTLTPSKAGEALLGGMHEVNDCLTGNKPEGEMILVFASAQEIAPDGSLLDMGFKLKEGVEEGDKINFRVEAEKLAGDSGDLEAKAPEAVYTVGEGQEEKPGGQGQDDSKDDDGKNDDGENGGDKDDDGKKDTQSEKKAPAKSDNNKTTVKKDKVKTGDETPLALYLALGGGALAVLLGSGMARSKKKK